MMSALKIAATGMQAQQLNVDVLSNNIANLNTTGFKRQRAAFVDLVYQNRIAVGATTAATGEIAPTGAQVGLGVDVGSVFGVFTQGNVQSTRAPFDMAIQGNGFFKITLPDGTTAYTRDGTFTLNENGEIVNPQGFALDPGITVPTAAEDFTISETGVVTVQVDDVTTELGQITLAMFINPTGLENIGNNLYLESEASGPAADVNPTEDGSGNILQGFLETSNVDPVESITSLITAQRAYELNSRVISAADEMLSAANQIR